MLSKDPTFDVIVCDLQMRDGSGADVYEHASALRPGLERRFVFMTGGAFTEEAQAFIRDCGQPVLEKPFGGATLSDTIARVVAEGA